MRLHMLEAVKLSQQLQHINCVFPSIRRTDTDSWDYQRNKNILHCQLTLFFFVFQRNRFGCHVWARSYNVNYFCSVRMGIIWLEFIYKMLAVVCLEIFVASPSWVILLIEPNFDTFNPDTIFEILQLSV